MPGSGWIRGLLTAKFKPGIQRGQRFVEASWFTPMVNGYSRAIALRCLPAFTEKSVACEETEPQTEVEAALTALTWTRQGMDGAGRQKQVLVTLNDGSYDTLQFWSELPERTVGIVRTARNRCLFALPAADAHGNRKYGDKAPAPHLWLQERKGFTRQDVVVRGKSRPMRYRVEGPFVRDELPDIPLMLIVVGGGKRPQGSSRLSKMSLYDRRQYICPVSSWYQPSSWRVSGPCPCRLPTCWLGCGSAGNWKLPTGP
jgi:hypothetical protein